MHLFSSNRLNRPLLSLCAAVCLSLAAAAVAPPGNTFAFGPSQVACGNYYSNSGFRNVVRIAGGAGSVATLQYAPGDLVELSYVSGARPGMVYRILRVDDRARHQSQFDGQRGLLLQMGHLVRSMGTVRVLAVRGSSALARVETICDPMRPGDFGILWHRRPVPAAVQLPAFSPALLPSSARLVASGLIVAARDFASESGPGDEIFLNRGTLQGAQPGQVWLIVRTPASPSQQWLRQTVAGLAEFNYPERGVSMDQVTASANLPEVIGQAIILRASAGSSTAIITRSRSAVYPGDQVIPEH